MSIIYDTSKVIAATSGTYTVGSGSLPIVLAMYIITGNVIPTITFGGVSMNLVVSMSGPPSGPGSPGVHIFALTNPTQGSSQSVVASSSGGEIYAVFSYLGVGQVYPVYQKTQAEGDGNPTQLSILPDDAGSWVVDAGRNFSNIAPTVTATGVTARQTSSTGGTGGCFWYDSNAAPGGLYTTTFSTTNLQYYSYSSFLLSPVVPPPPPTPNSASFLLNFM